MASRYGRSEESPAAAPAPIESPPDAGAPPAPTETALPTPQPPPAAPTSSALAAAIPGSVVASDGSVSYQIGAPALPEADQPRDATPEDYIVPGSVESRGATYLHILCGQRTRASDEHPVMENGAWCDACRNYFGLTEFADLPTT